MTVVVLAATPLEAARLAPGLADVPQISAPASVTPTETPTMEVVISGIGMVNAAHALTTRLLNAPRPSLVVQTGIGGAYVGGGLGVGDVALATEEIYGELGVLTPEGWESVETFGLPVVDARGDHPPRFNRFPLDPVLVTRALRFVGTDIRSGPFLTLSQVTGTRSLGDALFARFGAVVESMEGAAAAHVCALHDMPFLEVRGISNLVEDRDRASWRVQEAADAAARVTNLLVARAETLLASVA